MKELWRRILVAITEYRLERVNKKADRLKNRLIELRFQSFTSEDNQRRVAKDLKRMMNDLDAQEAEEVPDPRTWN